VRHSNQLVVPPPSILRSYFTSTHVGIVQVATQKRLYTK